MQVSYLNICLTALAVATVAGIADYRRVNRKDPDAVGFMPWPLIMVLAMITAAVLASVAIKTGEIGWP